MLSNLGQSDEEFERLNEQFQTLVNLAQEVHGDRIKIMQSYGL